MSEQSGGERDGQEDPAELLAEVLEEVADGLGLECEVSVEVEEGVLRGCVEGADMGLLIGRRGQTIDAVQHLAQRILFHGGESRTRVVIDADGYRERRKRMLQEDADDAAEEALRSGQAVELAHARLGAAGGTRVPARSRRRGHSQRGRGARAVSGGFAAGGVELWA